MKDSCYFCGGTVKARKIRHLREWGQKIFILENVPAHVCRQCGEKFFEPATVRRMDAIVSSRKQARRVQEVPIHSL